MNQLHPLKFEPILMDKIWGGNKLNTLLNKENATDKAGESWELSGVEGNISVVSNGFLAGNNLDELIKEYKGELIGQKVFEVFGTEFPLLIKYIDACDDLSIQVHPNDKQAADRHNSFGKTEMWYVLQADEGAQLISGFNQKVDKEMYLKKLSENKILDLLNNETIKAGDVYFIPAGRIHAIGKGCVIAEIQQTSDITYRVYDYDRKDNDGNTRMLHTEEAVEVIDYDYSENYKTKYTSSINQPTELVDCKYFTTNLLEIDDNIERDMSSNDSFTIYMGIEGEAEIVLSNNDITTIRKGETILIPAVLSKYQINPKGSAKLLEVYIK